MKKKKVITSQKTARKERQEKYAKGLLMMALIRYRMARETRHPRLTEEEKMDIFHMYSLAVLGISVLPRKEAQWLAKKPYSDETKTQILYTLGNADRAKRKQRIHRNIQKALAAAILLTGITAGVAATAGKENTTILAGSVSCSIILASLVEWASSTGEKQAFHANQTLMRYKCIKNPQLSRALTRLDRYLLPVRN